MISKNVTVELELKNATNACRAATTNVKMNWRNSNPILVAILIALNLSRQISLYQVIQFCQELQLANIGENNFLSIGCPSLA